jgi:GT2 family glycosyltransferase
MKVAAIVINWNSAEYISTTLTSLLSLQSPQVQLSLYLVDNHSPLKIAQSLSQQFPQFTLIRNPSNYGLAEGYNVGIRRALPYSPDFIWTIGPDTVIDSNFLPQILAATAKYHQSGVFGPKVYQTSKQILYAGGQLDWDQNLVNQRGINNDDVGQFDIPIETDYVPYYCMFIRRQVIDQIGLFDRQYFTNFFDVDFCQRAKRYNWKLMFIPQSQITKTCQFEDKFTKDQSEYFQYRNRLLISTKIGPPVVKLSAFRESLALSRFGTPSQKHAAQDYLFGRFGSGSAPNS